MNNARVIKSQGHKVTSQHWCPGVVVTWCTLFVLILTWLLLPPARAWAVTYYLDAVNGDDTNLGTSEQPWKTLNRAYTWYSGASPKVQEGDTVLFRNGDYGQFNQATPTGESSVPRRSNWITYKAESGQAPVLSKVSISGEDKWSPIEHGKSYYVFDGFDITDGVGISYTSEVKVLNCKIHRQPLDIKGYFEPYFASGAYGVSIVGGVNITIQGCDIYECYRGIRSITNDSNLTIADNVIHHCSEDGISAPTCNNLTIRGNTIYDLRRFTTVMYISGTKNGIFNVGDTVTMPTDASGIVSSVGSGYVYVYPTTGPNTFYNYWNSNHSLILTGPTGTIDPVTNVDPPHCDGFQIHGEATNILIENNYINREVVTGIGTENGQGFKLSGHPTNIIMRNNLVVSSSTGLISETDNFTLVNNIFIGTGHAIYGAECRIFNDSGDYDTVINYMYNNIISRLNQSPDAKGAVVWIKNRGNNIFHSYDGGGPAHPQMLDSSETTGMTIAAMDAMFVSAHDPNFNYHLAAGATAINFGAPAYAPATDLEGNLRDALPDAGCYEYGASTFLYGDVNNDGEISAYDAALSARLAVGLDELTADKLKVADVNGDREVTAYDAALIAQYAVGLIEKFPAEE